MARYHVTAWGNPNLPDIEEEMNESPRDLISKYPIFEVALLTPISFEAVTRALENANGENSP